MNSTDFEKYLSLIPAWFVGSYIGTYFIPTLGNLFADDFISQTFWLFIQISIMISDLLSTFATIYIIVMKLDEKFNIID